MAVTDIEHVFTAESKSVFEFLSQDSTGFYIPPYQRPYAWDNDNVARLLEDATSGLERLSEDINSIRFIGTIIAVEGNSVATVTGPMVHDLPRTVITVIDGQQRLCTLSIFNILLHATLTGLLQEVASVKGKAFEWLRVDTQDFLDDISRTFRFFPKKVPYPRVIRAYTDQWSRAPTHAIYDSPIARFTRAYIAHLEDEKRGAFEYRATDDNGKTVPGHEHITKVIAFVRSELNALVGDVHLTLRLPAADTLVKSSNVFPSCGLPSPLAT